MDSTMCEKAWIWSLNEPLHGTYRYFMLIISYIEKKLGLKMTGKRTVFNSLAICCAKRRYMCSHRRRDMSAKCITACKFWFSTKPWYVQRRLQYNLIHIWFYIYCYSWYLLGLILHVGYACMVPTMNQIDNHTHTHAHTSHWE